MGLYKNHTKEAKSLSFRKGQKSARGRAVLGIQGCQGFQVLLKYLFCDRFSRTSIILGHILWSLRSFCMVWAAVLRPSRLYLSREGGCKPAGSAEVVMISLNVV